MAPDASRDSHGAGDARTGGHDEHHQLDRARRHRGVSGEPRRRRQRGAIGTVILGTNGAVVGGYLAQAVLHKGDVTGVGIESIVIAAVGAIIILFAWRALTRSGRRT